MPRPKRPGAGEPKKRSRNGCWPCKARKVKCGEEKPRCANCERYGETCDYSIRLTWGGRTKRTPENTTSAPSSKTNSPHFLNFSFGESPTPLSSPSISDGPPTMPQSAQHGRSRSQTASPPVSGSSMIDPDLVGMSQVQAQPVMTFGEPFGHFQSFPPPHSPQRIPPVSSPFQPHLPLYSQAFEQPLTSVTAYGALTSATDNTIHASGALSPPSLLPPILEPGYAMSNSLASREYREMMSKGHQRSRSADISYAGPFPSHSPFMPMPLTPNSSVDTEDGYSRPISKQTPAAFSIPDRRLSVQALLSGPSDDRYRAYTPDSISDHPSPARDPGTTTYGYDRGCPDLDIPKNDDRNAITMFTPLNEPMDYEDGNLHGSAETRAKHMAFSKGGYYAKPVPIVISKSLEPLPPLLLENPMNLIYFHHFLNHTARILVPHDCEKNPFRQILPEMAVRDENILHLLLAFSASHRARLLNHPEPVNRIAVWVQDVFPKLRAALTNSSRISDSTLAPSLMMASLEIMSPNTFEVPVPWQDHLTMARQMIIARGGPRSLNRHDRVAYFLSRWFGYLDVLGSLSGNKNDLPLGSFYWSSENAAADEDYQIDCLTGFTNHCVGILARVAELAKQCEPQRIDETGNIREGWQPAPEIVEQAERIRRELVNGLNNPTIKSCSHRAADSTECEMALDTLEIHAANEMFHWAGLIHLFRRVLGKSKMDPEVQNAVRHIIDLLHKVRRGGTAEACLLFPMFTAGCDATDEGQREKIMERLRSVEGFGIAQVHKARSLMQRVWDTGKPWEALVSGEFFG